MYKHCHVLQLTTTRSLLDPHDLVLGRRVHGHVVQQASCETWRYSPANRHSRNSVLKFDINKRGGAIKTKFFTLSVQFDLFCLLDKTCFEKANAFNQTPQRKKENIRLKLSVSPNIFMLSCKGREMQL